MGTIEGERLRQTRKEGTYQPPTFGVPIAVPVEINHLSFQKMSYFDLDGNIISGENPGNIFANEPKKPAERKTYEQVRNRVWPGLPLIPALIGLPREAPVKLSKPNK